MPKRSGDAISTPMRNDWVHSRPNLRPPDLVGVPVANYDVAARNIYAPNCAFVSPKLREPFRAAPVERNSRACGKRGPQNR